MKLSEQEHAALILDQFTRQAAPFAKAPAHSTEESLRLLTEAVMVVPSDEVLDVACGPGIVSCALARIARHVTGIDFVPAMIEQAQKLQREKGLANVEWQVGDAAHLSAANDSFSLVVTRYSFHHLTDPGAVLREMTRVCRPGGRVAVIDVTPEPESQQQYDVFETLRDPSHVRALTRQRLLTFGDDLRLKLIHTVPYRLDSNVETLLASSFPLPGNADRFRKLVREDIGVNRLSIQAYEKDGEIHFTFPITIAVWEKPL